MLIIILSVAFRYITCSTSSGQDAMELERGVQVDQIREALTNLITQGQGKPRCITPFIFESLPFKIMCYTCVLELGVE